MHRLFARLGVHRREHVMDTLVWFVPGVDIVLAAGADRGGVHRRPRITPQTFAGMLLYAPPHV